MSGFQLNPDFVYIEGLLTGFFSDIKAEFGHQQIQNNGLQTSSGWQKCDECKYRVTDTRSVRSTGHYICYVHKIRVGANQICGHFSSGSQEYSFK